MQLHLGRKSQWEFKTSNSGGLGVGIIAAEGGSVTLTEPGTRTLVKFYYGSIGAGLSFGVKLPKIGRVQIPGVSGSSEQFKSGGLVYMSRDFSAKELTIRDIRGGCFFAEASAGLAWGGAAYAMAFGMNPALLAASVMNSLFVEHAIRSATGYLRFRGMNFGLQGGFGGAGYLGMLYARLR
jgi:hypothetical protein